MTPRDDRRKTGAGDADLEREALAFRLSKEREFLDRKHDGKNPYASKAQAKRIAGMTTTTFGGRAKKPYRCPVCGYWHVGEAS
jgi:rubrerythrin